jgi:hypothetical protein
MEEGAIQRGESSPAGKTMARAGWIMGLIGVILNSIFLILTLVFWGFNLKDILQQLPKKTF